MNVTVTQILRPIKLAFLITPNKQQSYIRALQVSSSLWGGKHFPVIAVYKKFTKEYRKEYRLFGESPVDFYTNTLKNFDPDFLVVDEEIDQEFVKTFNNDREIVLIGEVETSLINNESQYGISIHEIIETLKETEFKHQRTDALKIRCPRIRQRDLFTMTICGHIAPALLEKLKSINFPEDYISYPRVNRDSLNRCVGDDILNYLSLTTYKTESFGNPLWTSEFAIFIIDPDHLNDLINVWNYRALGWNILAIPIGELNTPYYRTQIEIQQREFHQHRRLIERIHLIWNRQLSRETVHEYVDQLAAIQTDPQKPVEYTLQWWLPRYWETGQFLSYDRAASIELRSGRKQTILSAEDLKVHIPVLRPIFNQKYLRHIKPRYINEVYLQFDETEGKYAQILPELSTNDLDFLIKGSGHSQWIFSDGVASFLAQENDEYLHLTIPKASEVFKKWFGARNIQIRYSSSGKLGNELLKNIGGVFGINFLANNGMPAVLSHFENGRTVLKNTLFGELHKQVNKNGFRDKEINTIVAKLLDKNIIEFGAEIQCSFCNQRSFYHLANLAEKVKCPVCQNNFIAPSHDPDQIKWAYRGMGPFSRNNKADGLLCVLLTLRFFKVTMYPGKITPLLSFELLQNNVVTNEVDLAVFYGKEYRSFEHPELFLSECKTENEFLDADVQKMKQLGILFPGSVLTFATLKQNLSDQEKERIRKVVNYFRKGYGPRPVNPILILTANELLPAQTFRPFAAIEHRFTDHLRFSDEVNHIADITCQHYLDLPSFSTITEARREGRRKVLDEKRKKQQPIEGTETTDSANQS